MGALLVHLIRKVAEGDFGEKPKWLYWKLAGIKTWSGLVVGIAWFGLTQAGASGLCASCDAFAGYILSASAFLISVGLLDAAFRAQPPYKG